MESIHRSFASYIQIFYLSLTTIEYRFPVVKYIVLYFAINSVAVLHSPKIFEHAQNKSDSVNIMTECLAETNSIMETTNNLLGMAYLFGGGMTQLKSSTYARKFVILPQFSSPWILFFLPLSSSLL